MKFSTLFPKAFLAICILSSTIVIAQDNYLQFKSGNIILQKNNLDISNKNYTNNELVNNKYYRIIQFKTIPNTKQKETLKSKGVELLNYLPTNAFYAAIDRNASLIELSNFNVVAIASVNPIYKLNKVLKSEKYPEWSLIGSDAIEITAIYYPNISEEVILSKLEANGLEVVVSNKTNSIRFIANIAELSKIYSFPEFYYFEEKSKPGEPEGIEDRTNHRSNTISTDYSGGLKFDGTGVTLMLQDNSTLDKHIDYTGRFFNDASATQSGDHGEHCGGIIGAAGNLDPKGRGMAYGADILVYGSSNNNYNDVPALVASDDLTITSKSYGDGANAGYTTLARQLDQQVRQMPSLVHVFSAGNSGSGWSTITGGHKQGKNVIAVGNVAYTDVIASSSSRGPALDGRIKPDICAVGSSVYSTIDPNTYQNKSGTSMACPGVAGVLAQLYHAYKTNNGGTNPNSGLIKASVLNTGEDLGNSGPDFTYGWGRINAQRAYSLVNNNNYLLDNISQGGNNTHTINVPTGTTQLRVMVYWTDYEGTASASPALVNDINMQVVDPGLTTFNPWILNPASESAVAVRGIDNLNNVEQVTIDNPISGNYSVNISGNTIPQGPQNYYVLYEFIQDEVTLTYPIGNEGFNPGTTETIRWDSYGGAGTFNLEYSVDNGGSWIVINAAVNSSLRYYNWAVPNVLSGEVLVRVTRGAISDVSDQVFSIIRTPINLNIDWVCPDSMQLSWNPVPGATSFEVSVLGNKYMDSVDVSTTNSYVFHGVNPSLTYWLSVRSLGPLNARGERAIAIQKIPGTLNCPIAVDVALSDITPKDNGQFLSCMIGNINPSIQIKNEGLTTLNNIPIHYKLNAGTAVNEVFVGPLAPGASSTHTFSTQITPNAGTNNLLIWSDMTGDDNFYNDSITSQFNYISSTPQTVLPWSESFETFPLCGTASDCETEVCGTINGFVNESNGDVDDIDWRTDQGGTPSTGTGPSVDFTTGTTAGNYMYLEASGGCTSQKAELISPCIDLTNITNVQLEFAYHMEGTNMGAIFVDVYANGVWNNSLVTLSGNKGGNWLVSTTSLNAYVGGIINLRFRGVTGNDYLSDMAIDDINISIPVGINTIENDLNFNIFPNPSNGLFNYTYSGESQLNIEVIDVNGKTIYSQKITNNTNGNNGEIDITNYANGIYMLILTDGSERVTEKLIKN